MFPKKGKDFLYITLYLIIFLVLIRWLTKYFLPDHNAKRELGIISLLVITAFTPITAMVSPTISTFVYAQNDSSNKNAKSSNPGRYVILNFDDSHRSQIDYAKPVLDKYGFKATFFHVCG
jgi:peptidoglycan/xylan/chitin deacetylase (PgdA/CDA1 family)